MKELLRAGVILLACIDLLVSQGQPVTDFDCYEGDINYNVLTYTGDGLLTTVEGPLEVCIDGKYESICDIGFDLRDAEAVCRYEVGSYVITELITSLGTPRTSYASRTYNCSEYDYGLRSCNYTSGIHPDCNDGDHVAGVRCRQICAPGDLRLRNETYTYDNDLVTIQGRVDVCRNGTYLPICDLGWDRRDAQVACRYIYGSNYIGDVAPSVSLSPSLQFYGQELMCNGTEYSLSECGYNPPTSQQCSAAGNRAAAASCRQVCYEGDIRLVNQTYSFANGLNAVSGVVQVCINQQYVYVCADNWDNREAEVVCKSFSSNYEAPYYVNTASMTSMIFSDAPIYRYSMCNGTEYSFRECQQPRNDSSSTCPSIATVNCTEVISRCYNQGSFRLFNESIDYSDFGAITVSGRIEVCSSNYTYKSVCYQHWDSADANVFCRGYLRDYYGRDPDFISGQISSPSLFVPGIAGYALYDVMCNGSESSIYDCEISNGSLSTCQDPSFGAAGVMCTATDAGTVIPTIDPLCRELSLRMTNQTTYVTDGLYIVYEGNIEVCLDGTYTAICDVGWDDGDAQVACNDIGFNEPGYRGVALSGLTATSHIGIESIFCPPNATASQCVGVVPPLSSRCFSNSSAAGARCVQERSPCYPEGEFGISNITYDDPSLGQFSVGFSARVGICNNGFYSSVCDVDWDENDATSLCNFLSNSIGSIFDATPLYGLHAGFDPIKLESVDCTGTEDDISSCPTSTIGQISDPLCEQSTRAAGVKCTQKPGTCINGGVRLEGGSGYYEGRLEVCIGNQWHTVCETDFDDEAAYSVCNERLLLFGAESAAVIGGEYGSGTGPIAAVCSDNSDVFSPYSTEFSPVGNCSSLPSDSSCSHERDVGIICSKGQVTAGIVSIGSSRLNSSSFALQSYATQYPWNTTLLHSGWYDSVGSPILGSSRGGPASVNILRDVYSPTLFNFTYLHSSQLSFDHPLNVNDAGYYSFNISVKVTYPDNSTAVLSNSSVFPLILEIPPPSVAITSEDAPVNNRRYTATCVARFDAPVPLESVVIQATDMFGLTLTSLTDRVTFSSVRQIDERTFARDLTVNPITFIDSGTYTCSATLRNNFIISHPGLALFNVTVLEAPLPPPEVIGLCTNVVWYVPAVSCEGIQGYDVRLFQPQSAHPNVTRRVGSNATFYILQDHHQMGRSRDELYVQVRVIHSNGVGEWSNGTSIGCDSRPTPTPEPPSVYFEINGDIYFNNSAIPISGIGEGENALYCRTDKVDCCGSIPNRFGEFYYPNGVRVPIGSQRQGFYRNRGDQIVRLNRREGITSPVGTYRCEVPNADGEMVKLYITVTSP